MVIKVVFQHPKKSVKKMHFICSTSKVVKNNKENELVFAVYLIHHKSNKRNMHISLLVKLEAVVTQ